MKKLIKSTLITAALSLGIWTLAVTFSPISSNFQAGAEVSAAAFNDLFSLINDNFDAAKASIESNETAISVNEENIVINTEAIASLSPAASGVKAHVLLSRCDDASSAIARFQSDTSVTVSDGVADGNCVIDFGFDISSSYWQVSPLVTPVITGVAVISGCTPGVGANNTKLFCNNFTADGTPISGSFFVSVF